MRRGRPPNPARTQLIADTVIKVIADEGMRGLSHRAVDRAAELPPGTAVYYAPSRVDLLVLCSRRLTDIGLSELAPLNDLLSVQSALTPEAVVDCLLEIWRIRLQPSNRERIKAEIAISLAATREKSVLTAWTMPEGFSYLWKRVLERLGAKSPGRAAEEFAAVIRGRLYYYVLNSQPFENLDVVRYQMLASLSALVAFAE